MIWERERNMTSQRLRKKNPLTGVQESSISRMLGESLQTSSSSSLYTNTSSLHLEKEHV